MKKIKFRRKKEPFPKNSDVRVKNSYYTFSKEYPAAKIVKTKRVRRKKERVARVWRTLLAALCFALIVGLSYFAVSIGLNFSKKPIDTGSEFPAATDTSSENIFQSGSLKALYMPFQKLSNRRELSSFVKKIQKKDCNAVVIDFKTESGKLLYSSQSEIARSGKCAIFDNETVKTALRTFENGGIGVVARFFCFEDETASETEPSFAVKYKDTDVLWRDNISNGEGKAWLNPYSDGASAYLLELLREISSMGVKGIILESVSFPNADLSTAGFPGEKSAGKRASVLSAFVQKAKESVSKSCFVLVAESASNITSPEEGNYSAELLKSVADGLCLNTLSRPENYIADKKSGYSSMLSLFSQIRQRQNESSVFVPVIDMSEYSRKYIRILGESGYENFVLFDESGNY